MRELRDIGVLGSGPAALALADAAARRGASVTLIAPSPKAGWQPNYCLWADELPPAFAPAVEHVWPEVGVATPIREHRLRRSYLKLHTDAFQQLLWHRLLEADAEVIGEAASEVEHDRDETRVTLGSGDVARVRVLVDASGPGTRFTRRVHARPPAHQIAYGVLLDAPGHRVDVERATLMDFRPAVQDAVEPPSFLYLLPLSRERVFLEETSLAHRPGVAPALLRTRLQARLRALGLQDANVVSEEHCAIPMGLGLPSTGQRVVSYGAAASMVHPASGYSIAHVLRKAEPVADALVDALGSGDAAHAASAANQAVWPRSQRTVWELYAFGLETLVDMNAEETSRFFDAFFAMPLDSWAGFLGGTLSPAELGAVMTRLFRSLPAPLRWHLVRTGVFAGAAPLARTVLQPGMT